ncbi:MAG: hypothetical protein HY005_00885 [Candidatus Staskawiczbacteria bacterium]|nr:hypothetical protein [Candidatus Staskawiczbacteria bacterium]MBI3337163.1 hypothetical protein [Candidatus Staskawiczbacteria bacterium]
MYHNIIFKNNKGVSLIITFFILTIILAIVLSISALSYNQIKIIRSVGNSVSAFYAAESGLEKVLYYDRKQIPAGGARGSCDISNVCPVCDPGLPGDCQEVNCYDWQITGNDCDPLTCSDCQITFKSKINTSGSYNIDMTVIQQCKISTGTVNSYGFYKDVSRAIKLDSAQKVSSLVIPFSGATAHAQGQTGVNMVISAIVTDPNNVGIDVVVAAITGLGDENENQCDPSPPPPFTECTYREVVLEPVGDGSYSKPWNFGLQGVDYSINIMAVDNDGNCVEVSDITITWQ